MSPQTISVLVIASDPALAAPSWDLLGATGDPFFSLERTPTLEAGLARLGERPVDVLLLDLALPGMLGLEALVRARRGAPDIAIVVLAEEGDEEVALAALAAGAQDCIAKAELDGPALARVVRRAVARKRVEQELSAAREAAEQASLSKSEFLARLSHELRAPLTAVIGFSEMMVQEMLGPLGNARYLQYAKDITASGTFMLDLVNDILDFAKVESGKIELQESEIDVAPLVEECIRMIQPRAREWTVETTVTIPEDLPRLRADERMVRQILLNLLSNAVKFTLPEGSVTVSAGLVPAADGGGRCLALSVADTGVGIAPEDIDKAMIPFAQVDNPLAWRQKGTGLGLLLVARLVELHGGSLDLESEVGVGTTATVLFPSERTVAAPPGGGFT